MASLLQRNQKCFYCGRRSARSYGRVQQWECEKCEAVNYLDEVCIYFFLGGLVTATAAESPPNFSAYESSYPQYRRNLEERYPQVCENCEPRVRERIRATGYAAKTDHLRRMMERTKARGRRKRTPGWRDVVLIFGKMGWWVSLMGQLWWNLMCVLVRREA